MLTALLILHWPWPVKFEQFTTLEQNGLKSFSLHFLFSAHGNSIVRPAFFTGNCCISFPSDHGHAAIFLNAKMEESFYSVTLRWKVVLYLALGKLQSGFSKRLLLGRQFGPSASATASLEGKALCFRQLQRDCSLFSYIKASRQRPIVF